MSSLATVRPGRESGRIGLLGGSFNPAHAGHLQLSLVALKRLRLDAVWWMVSPQNPLKAAAGMAPLEDRMSAARKAARHPRIYVTDIERHLASRYTADTLCQLRQRFPQASFVWLMGADNMLQIPRWKRWAEIFETTPVAVIARPEYCWNAMHGKAATRFQRSRLGPHLGPHAAGSLAARRAPAWTYTPMRLNPTSATDIRSGRQSPFGGPWAS
jgi:nicotinate-nucleotide adenylyltransferase